MRGNTVFEGGLGEQVTDLAGCSGTHIVEGSWMQQLIVKSGIVRLSQGAAGGKRFELQLEPARGKEGLLLWPECRHLRLEFPSTLPPGCPL